MEKPIPAFRPNIFPKPSRKKESAVKERDLFLLSLIGILIFSLSGCGPEYTYPAAKVPESIENISLKENQMKVQARVVGHTVGALYYTKSLLDSTGQVAKEVHEEMGKVMMVVTRVALSSDLPVEFCVVVIRDRNTPMELVITRSLDDTKRANADMIGVEESISRTLFGQAKLRRDAAGKAPFVLQEVKLEKFLAEQIIQRIRFGLARDLKQKKGKTLTEEDEDMMDPRKPERPLILVDGDFSDGSKDGRRTFRFSVLSLKRESPRETTLSVLKIANQVLEGYHYDNFDTIEIRDYLNRQKLVIDKKTLLDYQKKKITDDELLENFLVESKAAQEAFKLFGFSAPLSEEEDETLLPEDPEQV